MTKIEKLIESIERVQDTPEPIDTYQYSDIIKIMKEYAEWYAHQCLQVAEYYSGTFMGNSSIRPTQINLPPHD